MPKPKVVEQPRTREAISRGVDTLVKAIAPTLGPLPRPPVARNQNRLELLDDGGVIARRLIALPDREDDVGAMLLRQVLWQAHQEVGDGAATAAVIYHATFNEGLRFIAAGANAMRLRSHLMAWLPELRRRLLLNARILTGQSQLRDIAFAVCYDEEMAAALAEVIDTVGQHGQVDVRAGHGRGIEHEFVDGAYWPGGALSKTMLRVDGRQLAEMEDAAILITDMDIEEGRDLVPLLQLALRKGITDLLLIVKSISDVGIGVLMEERVREKLRTIAVKLDHQKIDDFNQSYQDIGILTGAQPVLDAAGQSLADVTLDDFGRARWVWADDSNFGFASGKGDPLQIRTHAQRLRRAYAQAVDSDNNVRLLDRLGKLQGGLATVRVGGIAEDEIRSRRDQAERTVRALRGALEGGVVIGGGVSLLRLSEWLLADHASDEEMEARAARQMLARALTAPIRTLLENAGVEPGEILARLRETSECCGYDVMRGDIADLAQAGIWDVAQVQAEALQRAVTSAALALTIDVMVLHREPEIMTDP